jgi:hypothetical protein
MSIWEAETVIPMPPVGSSYTASVDSEDQRAHGAVGLQVTLRVLSVTTGTLAIRLMGREPFDLTEYQVNVDNTVNSTGTYIWEFGPGSARQPDGEGAATVSATVMRQFVNVPIPDRFFIHAEKSDASAWRFGVAVRRTPG